MTKTLLSIVLCAGLAGLAHTESDNETLLKESAFELGTVMTQVNAQIPQEPKIDQASVETAGNTRNARELTEVKNKLENIASEVKAIMESLGIKQDPQLTAIVTALLDTTATALGNVNARIETDAKPVPLGEYYTTCKACSPRPRRVCRSATDKSEWTARDEAIDDCEWATGELCNIVSCSTDYERDREDEP
ncbi:hypothetical protein ACFL6Y_03965 [Elusimicrobiota bacterium]